MSPFKIAAIATCIIFLACIPTTQAKKEDEVRVCVRWVWYKDAYDRRVYCVEWATRDCSNRLHKELCKIGG